MTPSHPIPAAAIVTMRGGEVIVEGADGLREVVIVRIGGRAVKVVR